MKPSPWFRAGARDGLAAGAVAGVLSGAPSTAHALLTGRDPLAAARAAGNLLRPATTPPGELLAAGALAHAVLSVGWGTVLAVAVRRTSRRPAGGTSPVPRALVVGGLGGAAIAALDLGVLAHGPAGRRWPLIRALPVIPQIADHLAFGVIAAEVIRRRGTSRDRSGPSGAPQRVGDRRRDEAFLQFLQGDG